MGIASLKRISPLIITIVVLWVFFLILFYSSTHHNQGRMVYSLDDTYIHMALAKNFAQYGVWGVTQYHFTSSSSSLLWTLLLSLAFFIFGLGEMIPLVLNLIIATVLLVFIFYWLGKEGYGLYQMLLILLSFLCFVPLHYLIFIGLEHTLQILLDLFFVVFATRILSGKKLAKGNWERLRLAVLALLVVMVRFEGLFLVFIVSALFLFSKRVLDSILCLISGFLPVLIYGLISLSQGWYFFPNSVLMKGNRPDITAVSGWFKFLYQGIRQFVYNIHIFILVLIILILLYFWTRKFKDLKGQAPLMGIIFMATVVLHMFFARSGFYLNYYFQIRYDTYLLGLGLFSVLVILAPLKKAKKSRGFFPGFIKILLVVVLLMPMAERGIRTVAKINPAAHNTYIYQYQIARFLDQYYQGKKIVLNDIGAPNYYADIKCLDIMALSSKEVGDLILNNKYSSQSIFKVAADFGARIAIINDVLMENVGGVPVQWHRVGQWKISRSVISNLNVLSFYALHDAEISELLNNLNDFSAKLPQGIEQRILIRAPIKKKKYN